LSILYYSFSFVKNTSAKTATIAIAEIITIGKTSPLFIDFPFLTAATIS